MRVLVGELRFWGAKWVVGELKVGGREIWDFGERTKLKFHYHFKATFEHLSFNPKPSNQTLIIFAKIYLS